MIYFLEFNASLYETLKDDYNDKYEYIFPELLLIKIYLVINLVT